MNRPSSRLCRLPPLRALVALPVVLRRPLALIAAAVMLAAASPGFAAGAAPAEVVIYRCTDAQGQLSLRSSPCLAGETQAVKRMARPQDAPTRPAAPSSAATAANPPVSDVETAATSYRPAPRPVYACQSADGRRYLSDSATGSPREAPQWVAVSTLAAQPPPGTPGPPIPPSPRSDGLRPGRVDAQPRETPRLAPNRYSGALSGGRDVDPYYVGSQLLVYSGTGPAYDRCERLSAAETCPRMRAEHDALGRALFNAPPGARDALQAEHSALSTWLAQDCR